jgi:hypothetical protein
MMIYIFDIPGRLTSSPTRSYLPVIPYKTRAVNQSPQQITNTIFQ